MAIEFQPVSINFGQGIDSKTDPKMVVDGKLVGLNNSAFTQAKQISKVNGYSTFTKAILGGGSITSPVMTKAYQNEIVQADGNSVYSYSPSNGAWVNKGSYTSCKITNNILSSAVASQSAQSSAIIGNYMMACYTAFINTFFNVFVSIIDLTTGTRILSDFSVAFTSSLTQFSVGKIVVLGGTNFGIVYSDSSGFIQLKIVTISAGSVAFGSAILLANDCAYQNFVPVMDVAPTSTGMVFAYNQVVSASPANLVIKAVTAAGSITHTATETSIGTIAAIAVSTDSSNQAWVYYLSSSAAHYNTYSSTLVSGVAFAAIATGITPNQVTAYSTGVSSQSVFISTAQTTTGSLTWNIQNYNVNNSGTVTSGPFSLIGADLATRPFAFNGNVYLGVIYISQTEGTIFFTQVDSVRPGYILGKCLQGASIFNPSVGGANWQTFLPSYLCPVSFFGSVAKTVLPIALQNVTSGSATFSQLVASTIIGIDFENQDINQGLEASSILVLNGGIPQVYDGSTVSELGFNIFPELVTTPATTATGGVLTNGAQYGYAVTYLWNDEQGNIYESAPIEFTVTAASGGTGTSAFISFWVRFLNLTVKNTGNLPQLNIYRTSHNGSVLSLLNQPNTIENIKGLEASHFLDSSFPDSDLPSDNILYTNGGILPNDAPPPSVIMTRHNNQVWMLDSENPNTVCPSNAVVPLNGLSFSGDLATNIDTRGGEITGLTEMDSNLVGFKASMPFIMSGQTANTAGAGGTLQPAQFIPSDAGCISSRSIITTPMGTLFRSNQGIYLLNRSLGVEYVGAEVQEYNGLAITAATQIPNKTQIRFLTPAGLSIVYDYFMKQWGTAPVASGLSADIWNGNYVFVGNDNAVYQENPGYYLSTSFSTPFALSLQTAWIKTGTIQGFQRVTDLRLLGTYANGASALHGVQVTINYDFGNGQTPSRGPFTFYFGAAQTSGPFQCELTFPIQKCEAFQIVLSELVTGDSAETMTLADMTLRVGIKTGLYKMPATSMMR